MTLAPNRSTTRKPSKFAQTKQKSLTKSTPKENLLVVCYMKPAAEPSN